MGKNRFSLLEALTLPDSGQKQPFRARKRDPRPRLFGPRVAGEKEKELGEEKEAGLRTTKRRQFEESTNNQPLNSQGIFTMEDCGI